MESEQIVANKHSKQQGRELERKIRDRSANVAVIGLGYVGLPLALEIASAGFNVIGIDLDQSKIATLRAGKSYIGDVSDRKIAEAKETGRFLPTSDFGALRNVDTVSICVPTPRESLFLG
jgi:UDP-N-acetyl-D-glucosamine dehydrogenase